MMELSEKTPVLGSTFIPQLNLIRVLVFSQPQVEVLSEEEGEEEDEEEDILSLAEEKYRPAALEKMIALIALLVEQSRSERSAPFSTAL